MSKPEPKANTDQIALMDKGAVKAPSFKVVKHVTIPVIKFVESVPNFLTVTSPIHQGKALKGEAEAAAASGKKAKDPAMIMEVINALTGEIGLVVVGAILESTLIETYPENGYVGKTFQITKFAKKAGKEYNGYEIMEVVAE